MNFIKIYSDCFLLHLVYAGNVGFYTIRGKLLNWLIIGF